MNSFVAKLFEAWHRYWFTPENAGYFARVRAVTYGLMFLIYLSLDDRGWTQVSAAFWMPISVFDFLSGPPRSSVLIGVLQVLWKISLLTSAIGFLSRISMITAAALGVFLLGLPNCFGKIHHLDGFPVLVLIIFALAQCLNLTRYPWPVRLAQALFLLVFFAAGYAKVRSSGLAWMTATNMRSIWLGELFTHTPPTEIGSFLAGSTWLARFAAGATVAIELSALPALFIRRLRIFTLIGVFSMQVLIALMLGVYFTPYLVGYALFLPWVTGAGEKQSNRVTPDRCFEQSPK